MTAESIKDFARQWDPFPPHLDEAVAAQTPAGKLFAAGAHLISIAIRLSHSVDLPGLAVIASGGWDQVRFHRPGLVGDRLRVRLTQSEKRPSRSRPDRGMLEVCFELFNHNDELVLSFLNQVVMRTRPG